jgi:uncharacterized protein
MTRSSPLDESSRNSSRPNSTATRRRYLAATAGSALFATLAGCASTGSPESTTESDPSEPTTRPSSEPETPQNETDEDSEADDEDSEADDEDSEADDEPESFDEIPLFDAHTHIIPEEARGYDPLFTDDLVAWMDARGVDWAVVLAFDSPESYPVSAPSSWVLEECAAYPDRLVPFCTVDPRDVESADDAADRLEEHVERGARGFGELKVEMPIDDARLAPLYELCADYDLPVLFHTDRQMLTDEVGLPRLEGVLASYPEVDFVAHAHGWWAHVDAAVEPGDLGSVPERSIDAPGRVWDLLEGYDNIYGDLSTLAGWNALTRDQEYGQALLETHHEQILFGSDYLFPGQHVPHFEMFERFDLELEAWANIRHRNIERLLR